MVFCQEVTFRAGSRLVDLTAVLWPSDPGVHAVEWWSTDDALGTGDGLFVDAAQASARWCAIADVLIDRSRPTTSAASTGGAVLVVSAGLPGEWEVRGRDGMTTLAAEPCHLLPCLAAMYGWVLSGNALVCWPFTLH